MDTVENAIIWEAGKWGILAYFYYRNKYNLIGYVDSDKKLWGQRLNENPNPPAMLGRIE